MRRFALKIIIFFLSIPGLCTGAEPAALTKAQILEKMQQLKPLPKIHFTWGMSDQFKNYDDHFLYQLARINHSLGIKGEWVNEEQMERCVYACARVNKLNPEIQSTIGINYSPWHRKFEKNLPPTNRGESYYEEIRYFEARLKYIKQLLAKYNKKYSSDVKIGAIILDCERFTIKSNDDEWNEGIREAQDVIHDSALLIFPEARIEWYGRGIGKTINGPWHKTYYWTGKEKTVSLSCALYSIPELEKMRETYRRTASWAISLNTPKVTPWVALGSGIRIGLIKPSYWDDDWDYDISLSHQIGAELNRKEFSQSPDKYAPYDMADVIIFFPAPLYEKSPNWGKHFIAYVRGAAGVNNLADIK